MARLCIQVIYFLTISLTTSTVLLFSTLSYSQKQVLDVVDQLDMESLHAGFVDSNGKEYFTDDYQTSSVLTKADEVIFEYLSPELPVIKMRLKKLRGGVSVESCIGKAPNPHQGFYPLVIRQDTKYKSEPVYANGYMPWTFSGWIRGGIKKDKLTALERMEWGNNHNFSNVNEHLSWWFSMQGGEKKYLVGATTSDRYKTAVVKRLEKNFLSTIAVHNLYKEPQNHLNGLLCSEKLVVLPLNSVKDLDEYGALLKIKDQRSKHNFAGWNSWYHHFNEITPADIANGASGIKHNKLDDIGYKTIYIDDGWQKAWGDWTENTSFARTGLSLISRQITEKGLIPGIWMAPYLAEKDSDLLNNHPEYFLKDDEGEPLPYNDLHLVPFHKPKYFVLDTTHPEVKKYLRERLQWLYSIGFRVFKLDFLFAASYEAERKIPLTSMESYRQSLQWLKDSVPADANFLLSGGLLFPSLQSGDAYRLGPDVLHKALSKNWSFIATSARNGGNLFFLGNNGFNGDLDPFLLDTRWNDAQVHTKLVFHYLVGGPHVLSEDLIALSNHRLSFLLDSEMQELFSFNGKMYPLDYFDLVNKKAYSPFVTPILDGSKYSSENSQLLFKYNSKRAYLGVFNWKKDETTLVVDLDQLPVAAKNWKVSQLTQATYRQDNNLLIFDLKPYESALIIID